MTLLLDCKVGIINGLGYISLTLQTITHKNVMHHPYPYNKVTGCVFVCLFVCTEGSRRNIYINAT